MASRWPSPFASASSGPCLLDFDGKAFIFIKKGRSRGGLRMDNELARHIVRTTFRPSTGLEDLLALVRRHCGEEVARTDERAIAGAIADIHRMLMSPLCRAPVLAGIGR